MMDENVHWEESSQPHPCSEEEILDFRSTRARQGSRHLRSAVHPRWHHWEGLTVFENVFQSNAYIVS